MRSYYDTLAGKYPAVFYETRQYCYEQGKEKYFSLAFWQEVG